MTGDMEKLDGYRELECGSRSKAHMSDLRLGR